MASTDLSPEEAAAMLRQAGIEALQRQAGYVPLETKEPLPRIKLNVNLIQAPTMTHPLFRWMKAAYNIVPGGRIMDQLQQVLRWRLFAGKEHPVQELLHLGWYKMILSDILHEEEHGKPRHRDWE